ncbi:MAG: SGNH/GDSL hydrolase family protein [Bacteroidota bacterium]
MATLAEILIWFMTGKKPTQAQFWTTLNSFWHKLEQIPISAIAGLSNILNAKAEKTQFDAHKTANDAHQALFELKQSLTEKGEANGYVPLNELVKIASQYLDIVDDLVTGGSTALLSAEQGKVLQERIDAINLILTSDDVNLDTVQELVDAIKTVETSLQTILVNDLTTGGTTKALTAEMGKSLKALIDALGTIVAGKQDTLVSGTNIKTINGFPILGGGDLVVAGTEDSPDYLGNLIEDNFTRGSLGPDYTVTGTASFAILSNKLRVSGDGSSSNFSNNCFYTAKLTNSENFVATMRYNFYQITAADFGLGFLIQSLGATFKYSFYIALNISTDANRGKLNVWSSTTSNGSSFTNLNTTTRALIITVGDEIEYKIIRNGSKYIFRAINKNTKDSVSYFLDSSLSAGYSVSSIVNNVCKIGFSKQDSAASTAIYDITYFKVERDLIKNRKFLFIGDSISFGYESGAINNRWPDLIFSENNLKNKHTVYAQPGNVSNDFNINILELSEFTSQYVVVMLGMNEAQNSYSLATFQTDYSNLISNIVSQGKTPIICLIIPNSNVTVNSFIVLYNNWIISNFSSTYLVIDTYTALKDISYAGPHPTLQGHKILAMTVYDKIKNLI